MTDIIERAAVMLGAGIPRNPHAQEISRRVESRTRRKRTAPLGLRMVRHRTLETHSRNLQRSDGMTDIRSRLADALRQAIVLRGLWPDNLDDLAEVVLSLPGIAIVDPTDEATIERVYKAIWDGNSTQFDANGDAIVVDVWTRHRNMARAALAAAVQAQEEKQ